MASYRFPEFIFAIHSLAATRPSGFADEPYLSAQLNSAMSLPVHKDKNNHSLTWLIAIGNEPVKGCGLNPVGTHPHLCLGTLLRRSLGAKTSTTRTLGFALILNCNTLSNL